MHFAFIMILALFVSLLVGPVALQSGRDRSVWMSALDAFALVAVSGIALLHVLPEALSHGGVPAIFAMLVGLFLPTLLERSTARFGASLAVLIFIASLVPHVLLESAALANIEADRATGLAVAIAAHRLPVGLLVYGLLSAQFGRSGGWLGILALVVATIVGFGLSEQLLGALGPSAEILLHAFVGGSLLHVIVAHRLGEAHCSTCGHDHDMDPDHGHTHDKDHAHALHGTSSPCCAEETLVAPSCCASEPAPKVVEASCCGPSSGACGSPADGGGHGHHHGDEDGDDGHSHEHDHGGLQLPAGIGALAGAATLWFVLSHGGTPGHTHGPASYTAQVLDSFWHLALESAPALLVAYALIGLVHALVTPARASWLAGGTRGGQALKGVFFGLPLPICSCGVLPLYETLVRRGVPATAAMAFLVATPELGLDALLLSLPLLGGKLTLIRLGAAFAVAMVVALVVGAFTESSSSVGDEVTPEDDTRPFHVRLVEGVRYGLTENFDHTMPWIVVGLFVAALASPLLDSGLVGSVPTALQVPVFALIGIPVYVCATGATPIAAVAIAGGVSPGAAIAFLLAGPATNVTTFGVLSDLHGRRVAIVFGLAMLVSAVVTGWTVNAFPFAVEAVEGGHMHHDGTLLQQASLVLLFLLVTWSVLRNGPRMLMNELSLGG